MRALSEAALNSFGGAAAYQTILKRGTTSEGEQGEPQVAALSSATKEMLHQANMHRIRDGLSQVENWRRRCPHPTSSAGNRKNDSRRCTIASNMTVSEVLEQHDDNTMSSVLFGSSCEEEDRAIAMKLADTTNILISWLNENNLTAHETSVEGVVAPLANFSRVYPTIVFSAIIAAKGSQTVGWMTDIATNHSHSIVVCAAIGSLLLQAVQSGEASISLANFMQLLGLYQTQLLVAIEEVTDGANPSKPVDDYEEETFEPLDDDEESPTNTTSSSNVSISAHVIVEVALEMIASLRPTLILQRELIERLAFEATNDAHSESAEHHRKLRKITTFVHVVCAALCSFWAESSTTGSSVEAFADPALRLVFAGAATVLEERVQLHHTSLQEGHPQQRLMPDSKLAVVSFLDTAECILGILCAIPAESQHGMSGGSLLLERCASVLDALCATLFHLAHLDGGGAPSRADHASSEIAELAASCVVIVCGNEQLRSVISKMSAPALTNAIFPSNNNSHSLSPGDRRSAFPAAEWLHRTWTSARDMRGAATSSTAPEDSSSLCLRLLSPAVLLTVWPSGDAVIALDGRWTVQAPWIIEECIADMAMLSNAFSSDLHQRETTPGLDVSVHLLVVASATAAAAAASAGAKYAVMVRSISTLLKAMRHASTSSRNQVHLVRGVVDLMNAMQLVWSSSQEDGDQDDSTSSGAAPSNPWSLLLMLPSASTLAAANSTDQIDHSLDDLPEASSSDEHPDAQDVLDALTTALHAQRQQPQLIPTDFWTILRYFGSVHPDGGRYVVLLLELSTGNVHDSVLSMRQRELCTDTVHEILRSNDSRRYQRSSGGGGARSSTGNGGGDNAGGPNSDDNCVDVFDWSVVAAMVLHALSAVSLDRCSDEEADNTSAGGNDSQKVCQARLVLRWLCILSYVPVELLVASGLQIVNLAADALQQLELLLSPQEDNVVDCRSHAVDSLYHHHHRCAVGVCFLLRSLVLVSADAACAIASRSSSPSPAQAALLEITQSSTLPVALRLAAVSVIAAAEPQPAADSSVGNALRRLAHLLEGNEQLSPRLVAAVSSAKSYIQDMQPFSPSEQQQPTPGHVGSSSRMNSVFFDSKPGSSRRPTSAASQRSDHLQNSTTNNNVSNTDQSDEGREMRIELAKLRRKSVDSANLVLRQEQTLHEVQHALRMAREELRIIETRVESEQQTLLKYTMELRMTRANLAEEDAAAGVRQCEKILQRERKDLGLTKSTPTDDLKNHLVEAYNGGDLNGVVSIIEVLRAERAELLKIKTFYSKELQLSASAVFIAHDRIKEITVELHRAALEAAKYHQLSQDFAKLKRENVDLRNMLGVGEEASKNIASVFSNRYGRQQAKTPEEIEKINMEFRLQTAAMRAAVLQRELDRSDAQRAVAELDAVEARQRTKKVLLMHKNDMLGMDWARSRMKRLESECLAARRSLAETGRQHREATAQLKEESLKASLAFDVTRGELESKIGALETQLETSHARTIELAGEVRRKDMIISQLSNKLELLRSAPAGGASTSNGRNLSSAMDTTTAPLALSRSSPGKLLNTSAPAALQSKAEVTEASELRTFFAWKEMRRGRTEREKKK